MHTKEPKTFFWNTKCVEYGNFCEVWEYEKPIICNIKRSKNPYSAVPKRKRKAPDLERSIFSHKRTKKTVRQLLENNFSDKRYISMLTLTFKENVKDLDYSAKCLKSFIRKIKAIDKSFKYLAVVEFQKRGAVHYHLIISARYFKSEQLSSCWTFGYWDIRRLNGIKYVSSYILKYISKGMLDSRLVGRRAFSRSRNVLSAMVYKSLGSPESLSTRLLPYDKLSTIEVLTNFLGGLKITLYHSRLKI